jgi:hypothetical protein
LNTLSLHDALPIYSLTAPELSLRASTLLPYKDQELPAIVTPHKAAREEVRPANGRKTE